MENVIIQDLNLKEGETATCTAGYPHKGTVHVRCIKDFDKAKDKDEIVNNPHRYVNIISVGRFGLLTSHLISSNWSTT